MSLFDTRPAFIKAQGLEDWYASIPQDQRKRLERYVDEEVSRSDAPRAFLWKAAKRALKARDTDLAIALCQEGLRAAGSDLDLHMTYSVLIEAHAAKKDSAKVKEYCWEELELFPEMADVLRSSNGGDVPKEIPCRNLLIDVMVGVEGDYEGAFEMLDRFVELGILSEEERDHRVHSLKIRRLTRTLDSVFTLKKKDQ